MPGRHGRPRSPGAYVSDLGMGVPFDGKTGLRRRRACSDAPPLAGVFANSVAASDLHWCCPWPVQSSDCSA